MARVRFLPMDVTGDSAPGETLFDVAKRLEVAIPTSCVGKGTCGLCRVQIVDGEEHLSPYSETDEKHLGNVYHLTKVRLSCQALINGDVVVEIPPPRRSKKNKK